MKNYSFVLMMLFFFQSFLFVEATTAADRYHTVTLEITPGIELYGLSPGELVVMDGDHLHLQFKSKCPTATASDVTLSVDGETKTFKDFGGNSYFNYMINPVSANHKIKIEAKSNVITIPEVEGARMMPSAGEYAVHYGESFRFSILPDAPLDGKVVKVYANGIELKQDLEGPSILIYPAPLNYVIEHVTEPVTITVEGFVAHLNAGNSTTITLPDLEGTGARMMPSAGEYDVAIGESFRFSILPDFSVVTDNVKVYANGVELEQDLESPAILIYPAPMNYIIENVTEPVTITVKGFIAHMDATSNTQIDNGIQIGAEKGILNISSDEAIHVKVYNVSGQQVANCDVNGSEQINLQPGIYVVRAATQTEKVVIP